MFAFGNESNYGLSWSSFEIENLPVGEQNTAKARHLYSLFNEVYERARMAPNLPFTIVNGDIQYIDLIAELMPDLDVLGVNVYRGKSFTTCGAMLTRSWICPSCFLSSAAMPLMPGSFEEDQVAQAMILKEQWKEMYNKAGWQWRRRQFHRWFRVRVA